LNEEAAMNCVRIDETPGRGTAVALDEILGRAAAIIEAHRDLKSKSEIAVGRYREAVLAFAGVADLNVAYVVDGSVVILHGGARSVAAVLVREVGGVRGAEVGQGRGLLGFVGEMEAAARAEARAAEAINDPQGSAMHRAQAAAFEIVAARIRGGDDR
jgi:hypothetical protein